ncbi:MAG: TldD/PmbA family protein [Methanomicrobiaceae archaeon]|nr:TldD/PmbA family protein [Methanomicrobiaceae archaeon]
MCDFDSDSIIDDIIRKGQKIADEVEVVYGTGKFIHASLKGDEIGEAGGSESWVFGIRIIDGGRIGSSTTNNPLKWEECLDAAKAGSKFADAQEWGGLPDASGTTGTPESRFDENLVLDSAYLTANIKELLNGASEYNVDVAGGGASASSSFYKLTNSNGLVYESVRTRTGASLETISGTSTGYESDSSCFADRIDPYDIGKKAAYLAAHSVDAGEIDSGSYDVILSPIAAAQLIGGIVVPALSGKNVKAGRSYFAGKLGEKWLDGSFSLRDDPFHGQGSKARDAEGVPARVLDLIKDGVVNTFCYDLKTAYKYGEQSTGSAVRSDGSPSIGFHNLYFEGDRQVIFDEKALYIHDVIGAHTANGITGDFSVETSNATWREGGNDGDAVRAAMLSGNIFEMLKSIAGVSKESRELGNVIMPSVRFNNIRVVGK